MSMKIKDADLTALLEEVSTELSQAFGEAQALAKSEKSKKLKKDASADEPEMSDAADPSASPDVPADAAPAPEAEGAAPEAPPEEAPPAGGGDPAGESLDPAALQAEYEQLSPEELEMHLKACMAAVEKLQGGAGGPEQAPAGQPPMPEAQPPMAPAMKSEPKVNDLFKSEFDSMKEDIEILANTVKALIETPVRKAITSVDQLGKSEEKVETKSMTHSDIMSEVRRLAKNPDLKKSDRKFLIDFCDGRVNPEIAAKELARLFSNEK